MASSQKLVPMAFSLSKASSTILGIMIPNLWVFRQYPVLTLEMIESRQRSTSLTPHLNIGYSCNLLATEYSASYMGLECFKSAKGNHLEDLPFHSTCKVQPTVVFFACKLPYFLVRNPSALLIADISLQCFLISFRKRK